MTLRSKLPLFFAIAACMGGIVTFFLVRSAAESQFRSFVYAGDAAKAKVYAGILGEYRAGHPDWRGVQEFLSAMPDLVFTKLEERAVDTPDSADSPRTAPPRTDRLLAGGAQAEEGHAAINALLSDRIALADSAGHIVADTTGRLLGTHHPETHLARGAAVMYGKERVGTVLVGSMIDSTFTGASVAFLAELARSLALAVAVSTLLAACSGFLLSARLARPLSLLDAAARRVAAGDFSVTVPESAGDEVASLASSFNAMTAELRNLDEAKRRIIADSAHELRTPVTLIRGSLEAIIDGVYPASRETIRDIYDETLRLSRLIDTLRELELIDSGKLFLSLAPVDVRAALGKAMSLFRAAAAAKETTISIKDAGGAAETSPPLLAGADALRLDEVLYNLIENALKHTPPGGAIELGARGETGGIVIVVDDSGPGIPEAERGRIFGRFYRLDKSRARDSGGRGLGLSIAAEIVKAHGGSIAAGDSPLGGARFEVRLPRAAFPGGKRTDGATPGDAPA